jgi:copper resistance protein D
MGFAGIAVLLQAGHSHALAMHQGLLLLSQCLHLLAAGAWLGGLLPLLLFVRKAPRNGSAIAAQRFSILGITCVVALVSTAAFQLAGGLSGLLGTAYGWVALFKLILFALLLAFAALNYLRLVFGAGPLSCSRREALARSQHL